MRLLEVNYLRAYAIITIVIWHCFVCPLTSVWGILEPTQTTGIIYKVSRLFMPDANMPLFTLVSGYLFSYLYHLKTDKYQSLKNFFKTKFERLVIPFLVFGSIYSLIMPGKSLSQLLEGEGSHLWYCMMLFWCFMIRWCVLKINNKIVSVFIIILSVGSIVYSHGNNWQLPGFPLSIMEIRHALFYYAYFVLGELLEKHKNEINRALNWEGQIWLLLSAATVLFILWVIGSFMGIIVVSGILQIGTSLFFILLLYCWVIKLIIIGKLKQCNFIDTFCKYSFGIYVYHGFFAFGLYHHPFFYGLFAKYTILYAFLFTIIVLMVSFVLTHFSLKTKIGKYLLL